MAAALWLGPQRSFVFRSYLFLVLRWAWGSCEFNTKHQRTKFGSFFLGPLGFDSPNIAQRHALPLGPLGAFYVEI